MFTVKNIHRQLRGWSALFVIFFLGVAGSLSVAAASSKPRYVTEFERFVGRQIAPMVPGVAVAMVDGGKVSSMRTWGRRHIDRKDRVTPDTVFRLASVSKNFAATAAGVLVEKGQLNWDSLVRQYVKGVKFKRADYGNQLTLRHLLSHSTGLIPQAYTNLIEDNVSYARVVKRLREVDFVCAPGRCYGYQNVAFSLAGDMIETASGQSYNDFVQQTLMTPLGMKDASLGYKAFRAADNRITPHVKIRKRWRPARVLPTYYRISPAAGVNATIRDMSKWLLAQMGQRPDVLSPELLDTIQRPVIRNSRRQSHFRSHKLLGATWYGLGWRIFNFGPHQNFVYHGGWVKGSRAIMVFNRELQIGMVFLTNAETKLARKIVYRYLELYLKHAT